MFYQEQGSEILKFISSVKEEWTGLFKRIEKALIEADYGRFGISVGIIEKEGEIPQMHDASFFFSNPSYWKFVKLTMILVLKSNFERKP